MKFVVATGGTGGHIFPALQTACVLRDRGHTVVFVGSLSNAQAKIEAQGFRVLVIKAQGLTSRSLSGLFGFSSAMTQAIGKAREILKQERPDKVIGFGGYGSFAVVLSAWGLRIPTMIHEQNVVPGKANRLLAKIVKKVAISFPETKNYLGTEKTVWTGCPCHQTKSIQSREALLKKFSLDPGRPTILLLGGSQGSQKLNEEFFNLIVSGTLPPLVQAIHMTGAKEYALYQTRYEISPVPVQVLEFISPIEEAYAVADVVITRAGAATVSELGFFGIPSILIPYPLADNHQKYNAQVLAQLGLAQVIEQKDLTQGALKEAIETMLKTKRDEDSYGQRKKEFFKDSPANELAVALETL